MFKLILISAVLTGCGVDDDDSTLDLRSSVISNVDGDFVDYVEQFKQDFKPVYDVPSIEYGSLREGVLGTCYPSGRIRISDSEYQDLTDSARRWVLYHELGHCALGLDHTETGIMTAYIYINITLTDERWQELVDDLKQTVTNNP